jgi:integrase
MKKPNKVSNTTDSLYENVHRHGTWLSGLRERAERELTPKMFEMFTKYDNDLVMSAVANSTRHTALSKFLLVAGKYDVEDFTTITKEQINTIVVEIMNRYSSNGQETHYSCDCKKQLKCIVRFAKTGSRTKPISGEIPELLNVICKTPKDKLTREDLPTDDDCKQLLNACGDSLMEKAMFAVDMEASTRVGELLSLQIKHVVFDQYGAMISVDGKTNARKIRIVKSVPHLLKWINSHPYRDDRNHALWISTHSTRWMGNALSYHAFNKRLKKRCKQAGITKRVYSHLFRHKGITDLAGKLKESESRIRHGWSRSSSMPSRYTHMNNEDVDNKMLQIMGVKKKDEEQQSPIIECQYCHVKYPSDTTYCETCAKPLDIVEAERMEKESKDKTEALVYEIMRIEKSKKSKSKHDIIRDNKIKEQEKEIELLKQAIEKMSQAG